jgi:hypothetical protein
MRRSPAELKTYLQARRPDVVALVFHFGRLSSFRDRRGRTSSICRWCSHPTDFWLAVPAEPSLRPCLTATPCSGAGFLQHMNCVRLLRFPHTSLACDMCSYSHSLEPRLLASVDFPPDRPGSPRSVLVQSPYCHRLSVRTYRACPPRAGPASWLALHRAEPAWSIGSCGRMGFLNGHAGDPGAPTASKSRGIRREPRATIGRILQVGFNRQRCTSTKEPMF